MATETELVDQIIYRFSDCRDCADAEPLGVCPNSGLPCEHAPRKQAVRSVVRAVGYYAQHPEFIGKRDD